MKDAGRAVWIDADACPRKVLEIAERLAKERGFSFRTVSTWRHDLQGEDHLSVDASPQATDLAIVSRMSAGDLVVTQDYGLAALVLARGGTALSPHGLRFTQDNIDSLLAQRAESARLRRAGRGGRGPEFRQKGPPARTAEDDRRFREALLSLL